jgi:hypothetical protein
VTGVEINSVHGIDFEFFDGEVGFEDVGDLGVEEDSEDFVLEGDLKVVMVGTVDDEVEADSNDFYLGSALVFYLDAQVPVGKLFVVEGKLC